MNRIITSWALIIISLQVANAQDIADSWAGGDGTKDNPYQIATLSHLLKLVEDSENGIYYDDEYFILTADITDNKKMIYDDNGWPETSVLRQWEPIVCFNGHLDGNGHTISGLCGSGYDIIVGWNSDAIYFIDKLRGSISNLTIKDSMLCSWIGFGDYEVSKIENCINYATTANGFSIGHISELINCGNYGDCVNSALAWGNVDVAINCYNFGNVKSTSRGKYTTRANLFNSVYKMENCMNAGNITALGETNAFAYSCYANKELNGLSNLVNYGKITNVDNSTSYAITYDAHYNMVPREKIEFSNVYSLIGTADKLIKDDSEIQYSGGYGFVSEYEMKSDEFLDRLNRNVDKLDPRCCYWKHGNNGFPVLEIVDTSVGGIANPCCDEDDTKEVFYNLQGIQVNEPARGLYIRIKGNHSEKVYIY